jgi:hypothetical protein
MTTQEKLLQKQSSLELDTWRLTHACSQLLSNTRSLTGDMRVAQDTITQLQDTIAQLQAQIAGRDAVFVSLVLDALARVPEDQVDHTVQQAREQCYEIIERANKNARG